MIEVYPVARNFSASGEGGVPTIENPDQDTTYGLASWITFSPPKLALTPEQDVVFNYKIKVPLDAEPGGHYASVLFASQPPKADKTATQVALASMVGSLILAKVPGDIKEEALVKEFSTDRKFYLKAPANFTLRISNTGNIHIKPQGDIVITNWGQKASALDINPSKGNILPKSIRKFEKLTFNTGKWAFGPFEAKLVATYGEKDNLLAGVVTFWIIPLWLIYGLTILILIIIVVLIIYGRRRGKRPKRPGTYAKSPNPPEPPRPQPPKFVMR